MKNLPKFDNQKDEIDFWDKHDATDYFDMSKGHL